MTEQTLTDVLAQLRHLYQNMVNGGVRDTASVKRIAEGLLSPAIAALERRGSPAVAGEPFCYVSVNKQGDITRTMKRKDKWTNIPLYTAPPPTQPQAGAVSLDIESAAKKMAECMDFPWEHMPEQGRAEMRKHAQAVIEAAHGIKEPR